MMGNEEKNSIVPRDETAHESVVDAPERIWIKEPRNTMLKRVEVNAEPTWPTDVEYIRADLFAIDNCISGTQNTK